MTTSHIADSRGPLMETERQRWVRGQMGLACEGAWLIELVDLDVLAQRDHLPPSPVDFRGDWLGRPVVYFEVKDRRQSPTFGSYWLEIGKRDALLRLADSADARFVIWTPIGIYWVDVKQRPREWGRLVAPIDRTLHPRRGINDLDIAYRVPFHWFRSLR